MFKQKSRIKVNIWSSAKKVVEGEKTHIKCSVSVADKTEMRNHHISWYKNDSQFEQLDDKTEIVITNAKEQGETKLAFHINSEVFVLL